MALEAQLGHLADHRYALRPTSIMVNNLTMPKAGITLRDYFLAPHYAVYAFPAKALADHALWAEIKEAYTSRFRDRDPQDTIHQWEAEACLEFDCREEQASCPVPFRVIGFSKDIQTPASM